MSRGSRASPSSCSRAPISSCSIRAAKASAISFWFTNSSLQPIALYELGAWSMTTKPLFVGIEPGYARAVDVREQTTLARNDVVIVDDLTALARNIAAWAHSRRTR